MNENTVIIACAGSGKTTRLVKEAIAARDRRIAIITYTNNNIREIVRRFGERNSGVPTHVDVVSWFGFLLRECARPYQRSKYSAARIDSILFVNEGSARYIKEIDTARHYFAGGDLIYSDKIAKFVVKCEEASAKAVTDRLSEVYTDVFVDEFQDLAAWDLGVIRLLLESRVRVTLVGDPRQHIYETNPSAKNSQYHGVGIVELVEEWRREGLCCIERMSETYRCHRSICEFANAMWPGMDAMTALQERVTGHDGVFLVGEDVVAEYIRRFDPQVLRYNRRAKSYGVEALNFGLAKGLEFARVLVVPTDPIKKYLCDGGVGHIERSRDRLHVAVTRAFHSVAFVYNGSSVVVGNRWLPEGV